VPWAEPDSIENEIVRALRFDPVPRGGGSTAAPRPPVSPKGDIDPSTTLGDLAERLEEALAQEVQAANRGGHAPDLESEAPGFDDRAKGKSDQAGRPGEQKSRPAKKETQRETQRAAPEATAPEPERRREPPGPERREEAPVISLNARRRESVDPLEDEMARLLGELTGDTKGR
jgi:hypothetical protein